MEQLERLWGVPRKSERRRYKAPLKAPDTFFLRSEFCWLRMN